MLIIRCLKEVFLVVVVLVLISISTWHATKVFSGLMANNGIKSNDSIDLQVEQPPSEGHCKLAEYMMNNSRYYTASNLRKASEISKQCQAIDDKKPQ